MEYSRSLLFFIMIAIATGIMAWLIINAKKNSWYYLVGIIVICLTIQWSQLLVYPDSLIGSDPWYHETFTYKIMNDVEIHRFDYYGAFLFHLLIGNIAKIFSLSFKWAEMLIIGIPYTSIIIYIVYKIGTLIDTYKTGLMSALVLSFASLFLYFGIEIIPSSFGFIFILFNLYLMIEISRHKNKWNYLRYSLVVLFLVVCMFINSLVSIANVLLFILIWVGVFVYDKCFHPINKLSYSHFLLFAIIYGVILLVWWSYKGSIGVVFQFIGNEELFNFIKLLLPDMLLDKLYPDYFAGTVPGLGTWGNVLTSSTSQYYDLMMEMISQYQSNVPFGEQLIKKIGLILYFGVGLFGIVVILFKYRHLWIYTLAIASFIIIIFNVLNGFREYPVFLSRHILLSQIMLAPMVAVGIFNIRNWFNDKNNIIIAVIVSMLSFTAIISPYTNIDQRSLAPNSVVRLALTQEELKGINEICKSWSGKIYADSYVGDYIYWRQPMEPEWIFSGCYDASEYFVLGDYSELPSDALVIVRDEINRYPILVGSKFYKLPNNPDEVLINHGFKLIHGSVIRGYINDT
jgi:hypothetical protein